MGFRGKAVVSAPRARSSGRYRAELASLAELDDAALVARCLEGEAGAWETIVHRYRRLVYAIPSRFGLAPEDSDEIFQTTLARLVERLPAIRDPRSVRAWLVTTAKRLSLDRIGRKPITAGKESEQFWNEIPDPASLPDEEIERLEDQHLVRQALARLPERCRTLLDLLYYTGDEPSYQAISRRLRMPLGSIGPTRARCLEKLLGFYQEIAGGQEQK